MFQSALFGAAWLFVSFPLAQACSRVYYETSEGNFLTGRTMDWVEDLGTNLWAFPRGLKRDGGVGKGSLEWTAKFGSVIADAYGFATVDGMNDVGLAANVLYLAEADYGSDRRPGQAKLSIGAWAQYLLDSFATVADAVATSKQDKISIVAPILPNGKAASAHIALSDNTNDSAILEFIDGRLIIHHGSQYKIMTNSPPFDQQLALTAYWQEVGGLSFLPGTHRAADRFVRLSWNLESSPKVAGGRPAVASVFSLIRHISVPIGISDPKKPNIATTYWRTVADHKSLRFYFESSTSPSVLWVDMQKLDLSEKGTVKRLQLENDPMYAGESSHLFEAAAPFKFLGLPHDAEL